MQSVEAITQEIKAAVDIVDVIGQYVSLEKAGRAYRGLCPFHQEKTPSFNVRPVEQYFKCFGCGVGGDVFTFMEKFHSCSFIEARQMLADRANITIQAQPGKVSAGPSRQSLIQVNQWAAAQYRSCYESNVGAPARAYVEKRGVTEASAAHFQLGYVPDRFDFLVQQAGRDGISVALLQSAGLIKPAKSGNGFYDVFRHRLMFPIVDPMGQTIAFGGRTLGDDNRKYINSPETSLFKKSKCLYGLNHSREAFGERQRAILVEGYMDVIMAHQHGFQEAVAVLGTAFGDEHAHVLRRYVPKVVLMFDADDRGQEAAERSIRIAVQCLLDVELAKTPDGLDPCDYLTRYSGSDFEDLLNSAPSALQFKWKQTLERQRSGQSSAVRMQAVQELMSFLGTILAAGQLDDIQRGFLVNGLTHTWGFTPEETARRLAEAQQQAHGKRVGSRPQGAVHKETHAIPKPSTAEEAAALGVLLALVCEPGLCAEIDQHAVDPSLFSDPGLQRIATVANELVQRVGEFFPSELMDQLDEPQDRACVSALIEQGHAQGNLRANLETSMKRLQSLQTAKASKAEAAQLMALSADQASSHEDRNRHLAAVHDRAEHFASASNFAGIRKHKLDAESN